MSSGTFKVSQGYEVLRPKSDKAFPIPCNEWDVLKTQISQLTTEPQGFQTIGAVLLGAGLSTLIGIWTGAVSTSTVKDAIVIAWAITAVCFISGAACLYFAHRERRLYRAKATSVVTQMTLIEQRFDRTET